MSSSDPSKAPRLPAESNASRSRAERQPGFRFTIGGMLAVTFAVAIIVASLFAFPPIVSAAIAGLMSVCLPAMLVGCLVYGGAGWRAFAIGSLTPSAMRLVGGLLGSAYNGSLASKLMITQQQLVQMNARTLRAGVTSTSSGAFDHFNRLAEFWDKVGYAYMTEETLFWGASGVAGLAVLMVQRRFTRRGS
jgi:hypothetical protein